MLKLRFCLVKKSITLTVFKAVRVIHLLFQFEKGKDCCGNDCDRTGNGKELFHVFDSFTAYAACPCRRDLAWATVSPS